jgi:hypothetical protein
MDTHPVRVVRENIMCQVVKGASPISIIKEEYNDRRLSESRISNPVHVDI